MWYKARLPPSFWSLRDFKRDVWRVSWKVSDESLNRDEANVCKATGADPGEVKWVNFHPLFLSPLRFSFFISLEYWNNIRFLWHYYKNSPPISESWIRPWASHCNILTRLNFNLKISRFLLEKKCYLKIFNFLTSNMFEFSRVNTFNSYLFCSSFLFFHPQHWTLSVRTFAGKSKFSQRIQITSSWLQGWVWDDY